MACLGGRDATPPPGGYNSDGLSIEFPGRGGGRLVGRGGGFPLVLGLLEAEKEFFGEWELLLLGRTDEK